MPCHHVTTTAVDHKTTPLATVVASAVFNLVVAEPEPATGRPVADPRRSVPLDRAPLSRRHRSGTETPEPEVRSAIVLQGTGFMLPSIPLADRRSMARGTGLGIGNRRHRPSADSGRLGVLAARVGKCSNHGCGRRWNHQSQRNCLQVPHHCRLEGPANDLAHIVAASGWDACS